ncbi:hypothetical protein MKX08_005542 [Trichoderma sp. CBMAI-0020]|nr:hypothetical protein MKX08_005542 [Trichoderma sp. CBMAI-0020]
MSWFGVAPFKKFPAPFSFDERECPGYAPDCARIVPQLRTFDDGRKSNTSTNMGYPGLVIAYGANSAQNAMMASDEWKNDPRSPYAKQGGNKAH